MFSENLLCDAWFRLWRSCPRSHNLPIRLDAAIPIQEVPENSRVSMIKNQELPINKFITINPNPSNGVRKVMFPANSGWENTREISRICSKNPSSRSYASSWEAIEFSPWGKTLQNTWPHLIFKFYIHLQTCMSRMGVVWCARRMNFLDIFQNLYHPWKYYSLGQTTAGNPQPLGCQPLCRRLNK